ncbi:unnamed protein product [Ectocarpus fasciculatus]
MLFSGVARRRFAAPGALRAASVRRSVLSSSNSTEAVKPLPALLVGSPLPCPMCAAFP